MVFDPKNAVGCGEFVECLATVHSREGVLLVVTATVEAFDKSNLPRDFWITKEKNPSMRHGSVQNLYILIGIYLRVSRRLRNRRSSTDLVPFSS